MTRDYACTRAISRAGLEQMPVDLPKLEQEMRDDVIAHCLQNGWRVVTTPMIYQRTRRRWVGREGDERFVDLSPGHGWDHELWVITCLVEPVNV